MKKVKHIENLNGLRKLYIDVKNGVRNLKTLKIETSTYGCLLIPILKKKLPDELLVIISRKFAGNVRILGELLKHFLEELQAKESCVSYLENQHTESEKSKHGFTASGFYSENRELKSQKSRSVYCLGEEDHLPSRCSKVTNINSRKDVLRKFSKCFICLKSGHLAKNCSSKYVCHNCNQRHHISICTKDENKNENGLVTHVGVPRGILLQTPKAEIFNIESDEKLTACLLLDSGTQRSYITDNLRKLLKLKTIRIEKVLIKTFGQINDRQMPVLDVVQLKIKHRHQNKFVFIEALCVPVICTPLKMQEISSAQYNYEHLSKLELADFDDISSKLPVGLLIGVD